MIERLRLRGIRVEEVAEPHTLGVERYRLSEWRLAAPFEGRVALTAHVRSEAATETFPVGSVRVPTDRPLQWGLFRSVLQPTEYAVAYVLTPLAAGLLASDAKPRAEFEAKVATGAAFANDPAVRLEWFYRRTPYADVRHAVHPGACER